MIMAPEDWKAVYNNTIAQVRSGEIAMSRIDDAVRRILRVKLRAGMFETDTFRMYQDLKFSTQDNIDDLIERWK